MGLGSRGWESQAGPGWELKGPIAPGALPGAPCAAPYHASSMKPMTNLRTSIDLSTWKAMISCQGRGEGGSGLSKDLPPTPIPTPWFSQPLTSRKLSSSVGSLLMISSWTWREIGDGRRNPYRTRV